MEEVKTVKPPADASAPLSGAVVKHVDLGSPYELLKNMNMTSSAVKMRELSGRLGGGLLSVVALFFERVPLVGAIAAQFLAMFARHVEANRLREAEALARIPRAEILVGDIRVLVPHGGKRAIAINQKNGEWSIVDIEQYGLAAFTKRWADDIHSIFRMIGLPANPSVAQLDTSYLKKQVFGARRAFIIPLSGKGKIAVFDNNIAIAGDGSVLEATVRSFAPHVIRLARPRLRPSALRRPATPGESGAVAQTSG